MAFKLVNGKLTFPAKTLGQNFEFGLDVALATFTGNTFIGRGSTSSNYQVYPLDSDSIIGWRGTSTLSINLSEPVPLNTRTTLIFRRENDGIVNVFNSTDPEAESIGQISTTLSIQDFTRFGLASTRVFQGELYRMWFNIDGVFNEYYNADDPEATTIGDATVNEGTWVEYSEGSTSYTLTCETATSTHAAGDVTLIFSGAGTAYILTCDTVSSSHGAGDVALTYNQAGTATITSEPLKDNTGALLANQALDYAAIYNNTTGALVLRVTGLSTNASGVFSVTDVALTAGATYKLDWKLTIQSAARMPAKAAV